MKPRQTLPTFGSSAQTNSSGTQGNAEGLPRTWKKGTVPVLRSHRGQSWKGGWENRVGRTDGSSGPHQWLWQSLDRKPPKPGEEKGRCHSGRAVFVLLIYVLSRSCGQAGWLPRPLSSPGKPQAQLQACGRPPCCLWAPGHHRTQPAEDIASNGLTDTQTHATTQWPQDHSNSGHTEPRNPVASHSAATISQKPDHAAPPAKPPVFPLSLRVKPGLQLRSPRPRASPSRALGSCSPTLLPTRHTSGAFAGAPGSGLRMGSNGTRHRDAASRGEARRTQPAG